MHVDVVQEPIDQIAVILSLSNLQSLPVHLDLRPCRWILLQQIIRQRLAHDWLLQPAMGAAIRAEPDGVAEAVQMAKYFGAEVIGVCSTANLEMVQSIGADRVIDYTQERIPQSGEGFDIIFDAVGKISFSQCKGALKPGGVFLSSAMTDFDGVFILECLDRKNCYATDLQAMPC